MVLMARDLILSLLLNIIPLAVFAIPIPFLKRKTAKRSFYLRLYYGLCFFFAVYWILPAILQFDVKPLSLEDTPPDQPGLITFYLLTRSLSLITTYAQYPFILLPMIFVLSPFISYFILLVRIKKQSKREGIDIFQEIHYEYAGSPKNIIKKALRKSDWSKEKEMFKAFLIIMPIAIYLLAVVVDIAGLEPVNLNKSTTAIGMLIEIFFVYIATFLYGYQLIKSSRLAFRGKFIGEQIEARFFSSLKQVGTPIAVLSIILFIIQQTGSILLLIYIFAYFLMAAFTFILFMRIFEPISILILLKIINFRKSWRIKIQKFKTQKIKTPKKNQDSPVDHPETNLGQESTPPTESENIDRFKPMETIKKYSSHPSFRFVTIIVLYALIASSISVFIYLVFNLIGSYVVQYVPEGIDITQISAASASPSYLASLITDFSVSLHSIQLIVVVFTLAFLFNLSMRTKLHNSTVIVIYSATLIITTVAFSFLLNIGLAIPLSFIEETSWLTGVPVYISRSNFTFYTLRTGFLTASFSGNMVLRALTIPFYLLGPFCQYLLWGFLLYFVNRRFSVISLEKGRNYVERVTYSLVNPEDITDLKMFYENHPFAWIQINQAETLGDLEFKEVQAEQFRQTLLEKGNYRLHEISSTLLQDPKFEKWLRKQFRRKKLLMWIPEFSCLIERAQIDSIYLLYKDGRNLFYFQTQDSLKPAKNDGKAENISLDKTPSAEKMESGENNEITSKVNYMPSLVSGMFSAITSFVKEVTNSADLLRSIDSGDKKVILEYSSSLPIFGAIFADRETSQVRGALKNFITQFGNKYGHVLVNWSGDVSMFMEGGEIMKKVFKEFF